MTTSARVAANGGPLFPILVAEDSGFDRMLIEAALAEVDPDIALRFVKNGEEALNYLTHQGIFSVKDTAPWPALALMDLNMPLMTGEEVLRALRADEKLRLLPVVILSTSDNPIQILRAYSAGANAFLVKPNSIEQLVDVLGKLVDFWLDAALLPVPARDEGREAARANPAY
jgi:CheY-like chemotaxis protein